MDEFILMFYNFQAIEVQHGSMLALGFIIGMLLRKRRSQEILQNSSNWQKIEKRIEVAVLAIGKTRALLCGRLLLIKMFLSK